MDPAAGSADYEELEFLSVLIEAYEAERDDSPQATPQEIVEEMAQAHGVSRGELRACSADVAAYRSS